MVEGLVMDGRIAAEAYGFAVGGFPYRPLLNPCSAPKTFSHSHVKLLSDK